MDMNACRHPLPTPPSPKTRITRGDLNLELTHSRGGAHALVLFFLLTMIPRDKTEYLIVNIYLFNASAYFRLVLVLL